MIMRKYIVLAACALLMPAFAAVADPGEEALGFARVPHDPISLGMGGAGVVNGSAYSTFTNMAAVPFADFKLDVEAAYGKWAPDGSPTSNITVGGAWNLNKKFALGLGFNYGAGDEYDVYSENGQANGTFTPNELQVNLGFGWRFLDFLSAGVNVKYLSNKLADDYSYNAVAADVFVQAKLADFKATIGVSSLGSSVDSEAGDSYDLPTSLTIGGGYGHTFAKKHGIDALVDLDYYFSGEFAASVGAQYTYRQIASVRAGYHYGGDSVIPDFASVGAGLNLLGIKINFAYVIAGSDSPIKNSFSIGVGYSF